MSDIVSFGEWVQVRRNRLGLSRTGLARLIHCSPVTIKKIERDERRPSSQIAELLAQHLQLPESEHESFMARARGEFVSNFISPTELSIEEAQAPASEDERPKHNLPHQPTPFFGRVQDLAEIDSQLANPNCRLLTILGAGGMGKTRLSIEAARAQTENFTDGITFVELAPIDANRSEGEINPLATALADALGIGFHGESPPEQQLSDYLSRREMLIVYDNFEHLVETAVFLSTLLSHAADIKILVTSRERLNRQEEWLYALQGLSTPSSSDLKTSDAVQFFVERAKQVKSSFNDTAELAGIQRICQLVAGMPLGIELSASWVLQLSCEEIANEIEEELDFLTTEMRNVPDRHRSVRAVWEYSWEKLTDKERAVLKKLSVFRGGFERKAAKAVAGASLRLLAKLVSKSLLSVGGNGRYTIHELLRQFAAEKLAANPTDLAETQLQHSHYYLTFIANQEPNLTEEKRVATLDTIEETIDNVRLAIKHAVIHTPALFTIPVNLVLFTFYLSRSWIIEHEQLLQLITTALKPDCLASQEDGAVTPSSACLTWAAYQITKGYRQARRGQGEEGENSIREGLGVLSPSDPDPYAIRGWGLYWLSWSIGAQGNYPKAIHSLEESIREFENNDWPILKRSMFSRLGEYYLLFA